MKPKIILCGHGRHGKDTVAEYLRDKHGFKFESSSHFCSDTLVFPELKDKYGYKTSEECFNDRSNHRAEWYNIIAGFCSANPSKLTELIFKENDLYVGMRNPAEFNAGLHLADLTIWVDRSEHLPPEPEDSNGIEPGMCDIVINNNGTLEELYHRVDYMLIYSEELFGRKGKRPYPF